MAVWPRSTHPHRIHQVQPRTQPGSSSIEPAVLLLHWTESQVLVTSCLQALVSGAGTCPFSTPRGGRSGRLKSSESLPHHQGKSAFHQSHMGSPVYVPEGE